MSDGGGSEQAKRRAAAPPMSGPAASASRSATPSAFGNAATIRVGTPAAGGTLPEGLGNAATARAAAASFTEGGDSNFGGLGSAGNRAVAALPRLGPAGRAGPTVQRDKSHSARFSGDPKIADVVAGVATLAVGASGTAVVRLQQALIDLRYLPLAGGSGTFDAMTRAALMKFQHDQGIAETGVLDTDSMKRLDAAFDTRKPYVDMAKHDPAAPGTHALSAADRAAAVGAMVAAPVPGAPLVFKEDLGPPKGKYGQRIKARLTTLISSFHKQLFEDKKPLRADPAKNFHSWATLEGPAAEAKKVVDAMFGSQYGGPAAMPAMTHAGGNLIDQWEDELAVNAGKTAKKLKRKAASKVRYLINSNCEDINAEHSAVPSRPAEKAILEPIVKSFVSTPGQGPDDARPRHRMGGGAAERHRIPAAL